jgi:hypothetical protein
MTGLRGLLRGRRGVGILLALAAVVAGLVLVTVAVTGQQSAPKPVSAGRIHVPTHSAGDGGSGTTSGGAPGGTISVGHAATVPIGASRPTRIQIPAIGVDSVVNSLGLNPDGTLAVPQPGPHLNQAAWFHNSPTPGQSGPSIILGHVDSEAGESVFFRLGAMRPGDLIDVSRADGSRLVFKVNAVRDYQKASFPTAVVYGGDLRTPQLRLITCSDFDEAIHHHIGNEVVFSHLVRVAKAGTHAPKGALS